VPANAPYAHLLGHGRANLFRALTETGALSVRMDDIAITDNNDEAFAANDTLSVTATITNWLNPVNNLTITLSTSSPDVVLLDSVVNVGSMATLAVTDNNADPFRIAISPNVPLNAKVEFLFTYSDGAGYSDEQCLILVLNVDYINVLINDLGTSITSRGRIGYNAPNQAQGIGFTYNDGMSNLFESSFLVGNDTARVSDQMFASPVTVNDTDFVSVDNVRLLDPSTVSDFDLYSRFNDDGAAANKLGVTVTQLTYAWSTPADAKYIIVYYTVINNTPAPVSNVYTGIYADWDIGAIIDNRAGTDAGLKMGYAWEDAANGIYCGARVLGNAPFNVYAVDNDGSGGSLGIYNGFTKAEKFGAMSTPRAAAGTAGSGGDVSVMVASGPYAINGGDSIKVGFALLAADSLSALQAAAQAADLMFMAITSVQEPPAVAFAFPGAWPNPAGGDADIRITLAAATDVELTLFDAAGHRLQVLANGTLAPGQHAVPVKTAGLSDGLYFIRLRTEDRTEVRKFLLSR